MPNQQEHQTAHPDQYYLSFPDGSLSQKLLDFAYKDEKKWTDELLATQIAQKIYKLPEGSSPHYYQGKQTPSDFRAYVATDDGKKIISKIKEELDTCFKQLSTWAKAQKLEVTDDEHITQGVDAELLDFFNRLVANYYSDRTILFYADGKKSIEALTVLIQDESIDLAFRENQLISIATEGNLHQCADGCFSRFTSAAESIKNYGDFSIASLVKKFVRSLAEEIVSSPFTDQSSYAEALCEKSELPTEEYEIHAQNVLINGLLKELNLESLGIKDIYTHSFENNIFTRKIHQRFVQIFKSEFTSNRLVKFIIDQYYQVRNIQFTAGKFSGSEEFDIPALEVFLKGLGSDDDFNLHEVLIFDDAGNISLKDDKVLTITLLERLYNNGLLDAENFHWILRFTSLHEAFKKYDINFFPVFKGTFSQDYRVVPANIELTWLKDQSGNRILLRDCFKHIKNCFAILKERLPNEQVESLLINVNDLITFFDMLPREQHSEALSWMRENEVALDGVMLNQRLFNEKMSIAEPLALHSFYLEDHNKLLTVINEQALPELIKQLNSHKSIDKLLTDTFDLINEDESFDFLIPDILAFIRLIQQGGFKNFKDLKFGEIFLEQGDWEKEIYNKGIDFSNSNLENIEFEEVLNSKFKGATLNNLSIKSGVLNTDFQGSKGTIEIFGKVSSTDFSRSHLTADINGEIKDSFFHKLTGNIKINGNIHNSDVTNFEGDFKLNGKVIKTDFKDFSGAMEINGVLSDSNFEKAHGTSLEINGELEGCNLHAIQFEKIKVTGKISNSYLTSIDFTDTIFIDGNSNTELANSDKVFKVEFAFDNNKETEGFFKKSKFSTNSLTQFLELPSWKFLAGSRPFPLLRGTDLSAVEFQDPKLRAVLKAFNLLGFTEANLPYSNFDHFLQNEAPFLYQLNFENANLKGSTFDGANLFNCYLQGADLSDCDLSTANIQSSGVRGAKIDNLKLNCEQLLHFYEQGHRDFSSLRLVGTLENVEITSLAGTKLSAQVFEHLIEQGFKNFKEVDLMAVSPEILSKYDRHELSFDDKTIHPPYAASVIGCVKKSRLSKRDITCLINSDDLESFNAETNAPENLEKIKIDSERFLAVAKSASAEKLEQLIELASKGYPIVGSNQAQAKVKKLIKTRKWEIHLNKVGKVAGLVSKGLMLKDTLSSFLNGDYMDTAINLGFLGGGSFLAQFSKEMEAKGAAYLLERKTLLGNGLKIASPFVSRATSAYVIYDLVQAIKALNSGDKDAVGRLIGNSIYLGVDIGIGIAEIFGVSAITGPVGEVIGAVVFLGTDIYQAVERVKHIDEMIHLTGGEKFREGIRAFLGMSMEGYLEELLQNKQFNEAVINQKWEFLKQHPTIKNYLFPTEKQVCHKESYLEGEKWSGGKSRRRLVEVCDQTEPDLNNQIFLGVPKEQRTFGREKPEVPGELMCFPAGSGGSTGLSYSCENAVGIADPSPKAGNYTLINVGAGKDDVQGFPGSPNIIVAGNGDKHLTGGNQNDIFILQGDIISGFVDGKAGVNTLDLGEFAPNRRGSLQINLGERDPYLTHEGYGFKVFRLWRMQQVLARKNRPDTIHVGCSTSYVDGRGGYHSSGQDVIVIGNNQTCNYQMQMKVAPYTLIKNQASQGNFSYLVTRESGEAEIHFEPLGRDTTQHQISFNYTLAEIEQLRFLSDNKVVFNLMPEAENGFNVTLSRSNSTKISCVFTDAEMKLGDKRTYTLQQTRKTPAVIVRQGPAIATKLQGSIVIQAQHQQAKNQTVVIGYPLHHDVLQNDPMHPTHLLGNGGENIYKIMPRVGNKKIPRITLHPSQAKEKQIETLDLRAVIQQLEAHDYCTSRLVIRKKGKNLQLSINVTVNKKCKLSKKPILLIILKDAAKTHWANQLNIIMHQSFLEIVKTKNKGSRNAWILVPKPLVFDKTKKIIILSAQDIEADTHVILPTRHGEHEVRSQGARDRRALTGGAGNASRRQVICGSDCAQPRMGQYVADAGRSRPNISRVMRTNFGGTTAKIFREHSDSLAPTRFNLARIGNDLVITSERINQAITMVIKEFYSAQGHDAHKLLTLSLQFGNNTVNLTDVASQSLPSLTTLQNNKKKQIYNSIFKDLDATIIHSAISNGILAGLVFVPVIVAGYLIRRHVQGRQSNPHVVEAATALLAAASLPHQTDAKPIISKATETTEMVACHNKSLEDKHCAKSQTSIGTLIFCANNEIGFAWFKGENGYDSAYALSNSTRQDAFELRTFGENLLIARGENGCQQFINLKEMHEIPTDVMAAQPIFKELLKQPLEQYRKQNNPIERFKQQAQQISVVYLGEQCLVHTRLGDFFRVLGLTPNWQQRDAGHWSSRMLRSLLSVRNLFSSASISAVCLETALLHPRVQSALPQEEVYRGKLVIRFIADLLQFGPADSSCIPALVDFLCYQHPRSYEIAVGLRASLALLEVMNVPSSWYLVVSLFILPQLPYLFEKIGIPVTAFINHTLQMLERFLIPYSLMLSMQEDPKRLEAKKIASQEAQQRVTQGQKWVASVYNSGEGFFSNPKVSEEKTNDAEFSHGTSTQFAAKN